MFPPYIHTPMCWLNPSRHWCWYLHATTYMRFATSRPLNLHNTQNWPLYTHHYRHCLYMFPLHKLYKLCCSNIDPQYIRTNWMQMPLWLWWWYLRDTTYMHYAHPIYNNTQYHKPVGRYFRFCNNRLIPIYMLIAP